MQYNKRKSENCQMNYFRKAYQFVKITILFCVSFSLIDMLKGSDIEFFENSIKSVCTVCIIGGCKALSLYHDHKKSMTRGTEPHSPDPADAVKFNSQCTEHPRVVSAQG